MVIVTSVFLFGGGGPQDGGEVVLDGVEPVIVDRGVRGLIGDMGNAGQTCVVAPCVSFDYVATEIS